MSVKLSVGSLKRK